MRNKITPEIIRAVTVTGLKAYMCKPDASWLYFTDGTNIGYLENEGFGLKTTTVHVPNKISGTGFIIDDNLSPETLTREQLERAFVIAPHWHARDSSSVKKYKDWETFAAKDTILGKYELVTF